MKAIALKKSAFYLSYCVIVGSVMVILLETGAGVILSMRIRKSLAIFDCILCSETNVLEVKPFYRGHVKTKEFIVSVRTNSQGYREEFDFNDSSIDVAFMGDSFTFGWGVDLINRYSNIAAHAHPRLNIISLSYNNGFQPEHYEYFLDRHPSLKPRILFIGLYLGNDIDGDLIETLIERDKDGRIKTLILPYRDVYQGTLINKTRYKFGWFASLVDKTNLGKVLAIELNSSAQFRRILNTEQSVLPNASNRLSTELGNLDNVNLRVIRSLKVIGQTIKKRGGELHVLLIPQNFLVGDVKNPHVDPQNRHMVGELRSKNGLTKAILYLCESEELECHDLSRILVSSDYFEMDAHWNENGHQKIGKYTSELVAEIIGANLCESF